MHWFWGRGEPISILLAKIFLRIYFLVIPSHPITFSLFLFVFHLSVWGLLFLLISGIYGEVNLDFGYLLIVFSLDESRRYFFILRYF